MMIPLLSRNGEILGETLIDDVDNDLVSQRVWRFVDGLRYAGYRSVAVDGRVYTVRLHRMLLGLPLAFDGREGDHINRNKLDNRRANLRIVSHAENMQNKPLRVGVTSPYRGVHYSKRHHRWVACVTKGGKTLLWKEFKDELEAASAAEAVIHEYLPFYERDQLNQARIGA